MQCTGSNRLWPVQIPLDALPEGTELDANGNIMCLALRDARANYSGQPSAGGGQFEGEDALGLLGGDMVRHLQSGDVQGEAEKKRKKLHKALRQIEELKAKRAQGVELEKTQESKINREAELLAELQALEEAAD